MILRDWWLCTIISIMFEVLEYTLEHQLPNFSECWWDHVSCPLTFHLLVYIKSIMYFANFKKVDHGCIIVQWPGNNNRNSNP